MRRVHVVQESLTDYLRFEIGYGYPPNVAAGEDVRILVGRPGEFGLPDEDYWLFDSRHLWVMEYDDGGRFLKARKVDDAHATVQHNYWRDKALSLAVQSDYVGRMAVSPGTRTARAGHDSG
jgi:hypothetical protein